MLTYHNLLSKTKNSQEHKDLRIATIKKIESITKRPLIVYAANPNKMGFSVPNTIHNSDIVGFSDLIRTIDSPDIDIFLYSPGGSAEAAERIVNLLRGNFKHIRFIIPDGAYSAATMLALCGDELLMDERSSLGPIDPQIIISSNKGTTSVAAQHILDGFDSIHQALKKDPNALPAYLPILQKYDFHIFEICKTAKKLSHILAMTWLENYMLKELENKKEKAKEIADFLANHQEHLSHGRSIDIKKCSNLGLKIVDLRNSPELRDLVWELFCLIDILFDRSLIVKLFENSSGISWGRNYGEILIPAEGMKLPNIPQPNLIQPKINPKGKKRRR